MLSNISVPANRVDVSYKDLADEQDPLAYLARMNTSTAFNSNRVTSSLTNASTAFSATGAHKRTEDRRFHPHVSTPPVRNHATGCQF